MTNKDHNSEIISKEISYLFANFDQFITTKNLLAEELKKNFLKCSINN